MNLPKPHAVYNYDNEAQTRRLLAEADNANHKKNANVEIGEQMLILRDTVTGDLYSVEVTSGVLGITPL